MLPALRATIAVHVIAIALTMADMSLWPWTLGVMAANHVLLTVLSVDPRGSLLGRNLTRLPADAIARAQVAVTIDDGPDPDVTPRVLDILDAHGAKATFFCVGANVAAHPDLAREIVRRGHAIENHSNEHGWHFALSGSGRFAREIAAAQQAITSVTGVEPTFFRAPAGMRNPFLDSALRRLGLSLTSWTRRGFDTVERDPQSVLARLTRGLAAGDILVLHDGNASRTRSGTPVVVEVLPALLDAIHSGGLHAVTLRAATGSSPQRSGVLQTVTR